MGFGLPVPFRLPSFRPMVFRDRPAPLFDEPMDIPRDIPPVYQPFDPEPPADRPMEPRVTVPRGPPLRTRTFAARSALYRSGYSSAAKRRPLTM